MGNNIRNIRNRIGLSQAELAKLVGIETNSVYRHEKQQRGLDQRTINKYAKALGVTPADIISNDYSTTNIEEDTELLEQVAIGAVNFLNKHGYYKTITPKQMASFISEAYKIFKEERLNGESFILGESHFKLLYKQVANA